MKSTELKSPLYYIELYLTDFDDKFVDNLERAIRYHQEKKYPFVSWFMARSEVKSSTAKRKTNPTGKPGRPKTIISGTKAPRHTHMAFVGEKNKSAWGFASTIKKSLNKRAGRKVARIKQGDTGFINYCYKQAYRFHTGGKFDWLLYVK
jgi:hypothetical protein